MNTGPCLSKPGSDALKLIIRPLLASGGHARYPDGRKSSPGDLVVNVVRLQDSFASIAEEIDAIRRRLEDTHESEEFSQRRPARAR